MKRALIASIVLSGCLIPGRASASFASFQASAPDGAAASGAVVPGPARSATAPRAEPPCITAYALPDGQSIHVDGRLDDPPWRDAETGAGFAEWDPVRGDAPSEATVFKVAYDEDAVYFAVACMERDPSMITKRLSRRDRGSSSDLVSIYIDPYGDRSTGYNFQVNPLGVQQDGYIFNDGDRDDDWDAVWQAETYQDGDGWYAEVRIPFSSIRYRAGGSTWGLQVYRWTQARGEDDAWVVWERETPGFVSRFGSLTGLSGIPSSRQIEISPYAVYRATDPAVAGPEKIDTFQNFGADMKYGITADLGLSATFQPDFGQVEADPAVLNLSPFETFFQEKRPFFTEGSRFFQHPGFDLFYSRRIGTGDRNARIRYAAKLAGKTAGGISLAALAASTDITQQGQTHNFLKEGSRTERYFVGRFGKESGDGNRGVHVMQTAAIRLSGREGFGDRASREAYTSGADFSLRFHDRKYSIAGSFVGSLIDPEALEADPSAKPSRTYGTGGDLSIRKSGGRIRGGVSGRWESDRLELNDLGYLRAPDEISAGGWLAYPYSADGRSGFVNRASLDLNLNASWLYAARTGLDLHTGRPAWTYGRGHRAFPSGNLNGWMQLRGFWEAWLGISYIGWGTQRYETRNTVQLAGGDRVEIRGGGPLISEPATYGAWWGVSTDTRRDLVLDFTGSDYRDVARNESAEFTLHARWNQTSALIHDLGLSFRNRHDDTQHLDNYENAAGRIGGVSFVFGEIRQRTLDLTLRESLLFSRDQSLELYAQPFLTVADYTNARELARADTYELLPYRAEGFRVEDSDFRYASVNLNAVYRWEYRPGSTLFLVWTHSRSSYAERGLAAASETFENGLRIRSLFRNEPENIFLAKLTYYLPL